MFVVIEASQNIFWLVYSDNVLHMCIHILYKYVRVKNGVFRHVSDACQLRFRGLFTQTWTLY